MPSGSEKQALVQMPYIWNLAPTLNAFRGCSLKLPPEYSTAAYNNQETASTTHRGKSRPLLCLFQKPLLVALPVSFLDARAAILLVLAFGHSDAKLDDPLFPIHG